MSLPKNLTHEECGALLLVVGRRMMKHDVTADVVLAFDSYSEPEEAEREVTQELADECNLTLPRATDIVQQLTLVEAVSFNSFDGSHLVYDEHSNAYYPSQP